LGEWGISPRILDLGHFTLREITPATHWKGGWVDPKAVRDAVVKRKISSPRRESNPRTRIVQPVAGKLYERNPLGRRRPRRKDNIKQNLRGQILIIWTGLNWFVTVSSVGLL
jgi:hypothetical protein